MPAIRCANPNAFAGCNIGVPCSPLEAVTSLDPKDYAWGAPSPQQQQLLFQQFLQMHFLRHLHMSQHHNPAMAGAPMSLPLHLTHLPLGHLAMPQHCAIIPGLAAMPGQHLAARHMSAALPPQPAPPASQPAPSQASTKAKQGIAPKLAPAQSSSQVQVAAKPVVVKQEEQALPSKASTTPAPKFAPVPAVKIPPPESPSSASPTSGLNSADSVLSYLDKDDLFDGDFQMDMFDVMLSEHCDYDLESSVKDQASVLCGTASVPSPSSSNGSIATVAGAGEAAVGTPTSNENLALLQASVALPPFPEDCGIGAFDYAADFKDVADFEFTDLDSMVGLTGADLGCDMAAFDAPQVCVNSAKTPTSRPLKVKKGSGVHKTTSRRCNGKNAGVH